MIDPRARAWGLAAERAVRAAFKELGYFVVPLFAIEDGGAPMLAGLLRNYVLPDFLVARGGSTRWIEVKFKSHCVKYAKTGYFRHGIDLPKWKAYGEVERISGIPGSIAVLQYRAGADAYPDPHLLVQTFEHLRGVVDVEPKATETAPGGMVYWNVDEMDTVARLDFNVTDIERLTKVIHPWEARSRAGVAPQADMTLQRRQFHLRERWPPNDKLA